MHPRNRYAHGQQDYAALAELVPELAAHVRHGEGQTWVDFSVRQWLLRGEPRLLLPQLNLAACAHRTPLRRTP